MNNKKHSHEEETEKEREGRREGGGGRAVGANDRASGFICGERSQVGVRVKAASYGKGVTQPFNDCQGCKCREQWSLFCT